jgi:hypothetical protein
MTTTPTIPEHNDDEPVKECPDFVFWIGTTVIVIACVVIVVTTLKR